MKLAILLQCHKCPKQINILLDAFLHSKFSKEIYFFIHIDKKASFRNEIIENKNVIILPDKYRVNVKWGQISQVEATLNLIRFALSYNEFDFFWLCSGQDFLIKPVDQLVVFLQNNRSSNFINFFPSKNFGLNYENNYDKRNKLVYANWMIGSKLWQRIIKRLYIEFTGGYKKTFRLFARKNITGLSFYFGSSWWCMNQRTIKWIMEYLKSHEEFYRFYKNCVCPDESFFQTLIMNSPYREKRQEYLHYIDWSEKKNSPKILGIEDFELLQKSSKFMARKFDLEKDNKIFDLLLKGVKQDEENKEDKTY